MIDKGCPSMEWRPGKEIDDKDDVIIAVYDHPGDRDREIMIDGDESKENINNDVINETEGQVTAHIEESAPDDNFEEEETDTGVDINDGIDDTEEAEDDDGVKQEQDNDEAPINKEINEE